MMAIIGSGKLTNLIIKNLNPKNVLLISGTKKNDSLKTYVGENLCKINKLNLPNDISHCIINWSHTYISDFDKFKYSIYGFEKISQFILKNPEVNYIFISSTSASIDINKYSLYGLSKFIAEKLFTKIKDLNPSINIHLVRPGLIYGLEDCPIKKILNFRKFFTEIYFGDPNSVFAVTSAKDLTKYLLNTESIIWKSDELVINFFEDVEISLRYIQKKYQNFRKTKKTILKLYLSKKSILVKLANLFGKRIDLSLANINRYPTDKKNIDYKIDEGIDKYINSIS